MSLFYAAVCGIMLGPLAEVPATLADIYQTQYQCQPEQIEHYTGDVIAPQDLSSYFPATSSWWPIYTQDQVGGASYRAMIEAGIKPGVIMPEKSFELVMPMTLLKFKRAMHDGAIPVMPMSHNNPNAYSARTTFATALGLSPLLTLVEDGWSDNMLALHAGSYLMDHRALTRYQGLPLPARENHMANSYFYYTNTQPANGGGYTVLINPSATMAKQASTIQYPHLGMSWSYADTAFSNSTHGLDTNLYGLVLTTGTLLAVPVGLIFAHPVPDLLSLLGASISWASLCIGALLLILLAIAALRRLRLK